MSIFHKLFLENVIKSLKKTEETLREKPACGDIHVVRWPDPKRSCCTDQQYTLTAPEICEWSLVSTSPSGHRPCHNFVLKSIEQVSRRRATKI